jgi:hypothetical protein
LLQRPTDKDLDIGKARENSTQILYHKEHHSYVIVIGPCHGPILSRSLLTSKEMRSPNPGRHIKGPCLSIRRSVFRQRAIKCWNFQGGQLQSPVRSHPFCRFNSHTRSVPARIYFAIRPHTRGQITIDLRPAFALHRNHRPVQGILSDRNWNQSTDTTMRLASVCQGKKG